ncbi:MAG: hypothetical protein M1404_01225 [Acidobacteria bacterium]|nr:hypothetical protein [Acidobacteriota bacterium]
MFARIVRVNLKPGSRVGYTRAIDGEIYPRLKRQVGFAGQVSMVSTDEKEGIGISLWERREDAEAYHRGEYADVMKVLEPFTEGSPEVENYDVANSTVEALPVRKAA